MKLEAVQLEAGAVLMAILPPYPPHHMALVCLAPHSSSCCCWWWCWPCVDRLV